MLSGISPFRRDADYSTQNAIISGLFEFDEESWSHRSPESQHFIETILQTEPDRRPSLDTLIKHKWLQSAACHPRNSCNSPKQSKQQQQRRLSKRSSSQMMIRSFDEMTGSRSGSRTGSEIETGSEEQNQNFENPTKRSRHCVSNSTDDSANQ